MMPSKTNRSDYAILAILGLVTGVVLLSMAAWGVLREDRSGRARVRTTRSTNVDGAIIFYTLLERLGLGVERSDEMFAVARHRDTGVLFSVDRLVPLGTGEVAELSDWLFQGGVLVTTALPRGLSPTLDRLGEEMPRAHRYLADGARERYSDRGGSAGVPVESRGLALARDVGEVEFVSDGVLEGDWLEGELSDALEPLFADDRGVRIAEVAVGRGRVIVFLDSTFLANGLIAHGDNAVLTMNLASYAFARSGGGRMVFDEYHFGHGGRHGGFGVLGGMLLTHSAGWAVLSLTAAGILFLVYKGRQFGPRRGLGKERRRSKIEFAYAVGATFKATGAHRLALEQINAWFRQQVASAVGLVASASNEAIADELAERSQLEATTCQRILDECDRLAAQSRISERQFRMAIEQLARIEREALHGSGQGK